MIGKIKEIYQYRTMIGSLVKRDLKGRYKGSVLGFFWTFLNPLLQLAVYTFVFSTIMRAGIEDYYLFLFVALVPWIFFSTSVVGGASCIMAQQDMVKKIYFPREVLPLAYVTSQFINMLLSFLVVFAVLVFSGHEINPTAFLCLPIITIVEYVLALGMAMLTSAVTVYLRDMEYVLGILTMAWQWLTPVMYSIDMIPEELRWIFGFNPMTAVIEGYRDILYYAEVPQLETLISAVAFGVVFLCVGFFAFGRMQKRFAEEL